MRLSLFAMFVLAAICAVPQVSRAADQLVVVMPFDRRHATLTEADVQLVEEAVRSSAGNALASHGFNVMTSDTALALLRERGVDPERVQEADSALTAAKALGAGLFVSGAITSSGGKHAGQVRMFRVDGGKLLVSAEIGGQSADGLRRSWKTRQTTFFESALAALGSVVVASKKPVVNEAPTKGAPPPAPPVDDDDEVEESKDYVKAKGKRESQRLKRLCDKGDGSACVARGQMYILGDGVRSNRATAADMFEKGCTAGSASACALLGAMYRDGDFVKADRARAKALFKQSCEGGYKDGCAQLKALATK